MQLIERRYLGDYDICIHGISYSSGIRAAGKLVENLAKGRGKSGLLYLASGEACFWQEGQPMLTATVGDLVLLPEDCRYKMRYTGQETEFKLVNFRITSATGERLCFSDRIERLPHTAADSDICGILAKLESSCLAENSTAVFRRKELTYRLLSVLFAEANALVPMHPRYAGILPGVQLLQQNYLENIPVSQMAVACSISISAFRALFTEYYGVAPTVYRNQLRIKRARMLLSEGNRTVSEVARASGFSDVGYFCRFYKKVTGETPGQTMQKYNG